MDSLFDELFGFGSFSRGTRPRRGQDVEYPIEVTLEEAYHGSKRNIALQAEEPCSNCQGTGRIQNSLCSTCRGAGIIARHKRLEVKIPPGVRNGSRVRVAGKGQPGYAGGSSGDLYLVVSIKLHHLFERKGDDLHVEVPVPLIVAMLGGEAEVPTLNGKLALKVPPETQNGRTFRLAGKGMPHTGNSARGNLMAKVRVVLPTGLSDKERELFDQLGKLRPKP
jgi:DnaJ-class molecular chaperone